MARNSTTGTSRRNTTRKTSSSRSRTSGTSNTTSRSGTTNTNSNTSKSRRTSGTTSGTTTTPFGTPTFDSMFKNFPQAASNFGFPQNTSSYANNPFASAFNNPFASNFNMDQVRDQMSRLGMMSGYNNATRSNKDTVDAAIKSSQALAKAAEELGKAIYSFTQSSMELGVQAGQAVLNVRTLKDLVDVQSEYARNSMDHLISGTSRISDMAVKIANEVMEPLNQRVSDAVEKMGKAA